MKITRFIFAIIVLLLCFGSLQAQSEQVRFDHFTIEQGLSQNSVYCILQDHEGFMWFGTDNGLNRFDGFNFKIFKNQPFDNRSLSNNEVHSIYQDHTGTIWVGTSGGLNRFNRSHNNFTLYRNQPKDPNSLSNDEVLSITEDRHGILWVGTRDGLNRFDPQQEKFTNYRNDPSKQHSISNNEIQAIFQDRSGLLWIGTQQGLNCFDEQRNIFTVYRNNLSDPNSLSHDLVNTIYQDHTGRLWIGTHDGLNYFNPEQDNFTIYRNDPGEINRFANNGITTICEDRNNQLWIGSYRGVSRLDEHRQTFTLYPSDAQSSTALHGNHICSIYQDVSGSIWIATYFYGVNKYDFDSRTFEVFRNNPKDPNSLSHDTVWAIYQQPNDRIWVGTSGELNSYDPHTGTFTIYKRDPWHLESIGNQYSEVIIGSRNGLLWIGGSHSVSLYDPDRQTRRIYNIKPPDQITTSNESDLTTLLEDNAGMLWIGSKTGGLQRLDPQTGVLTNYRHDSKNPNSLSGNNITKIYQDTAGVLWIGVSDDTDGGLNRFDPVSNRFTLYRHDTKDPHSLSSNQIETIYQDHSGQDHSGTLWIGTISGLNRFDQARETFTSFTEKDGLPDDSVYGILEDREGNLWLSTNKGISKFNPRNRTFKNYDTHYGLQSNEFNSGAYFENSRGEMFFGGINGFNRFNPDQIKDNPYLPPIVITSIEVLNEPQTNPRQLLSEDITAAKDITLQLSYWENFLSIEFISLSYQIFEKNQFAYMMEGVDKDWVMAGTRRLANYTKLEPGEYTFKVKGSNNDGVWNDKGVSIKIIIRPPLWKTPLAYLLYGLIGISLLYGLVQYRIRLFQQRNLMLKAKIKQSTAQLLAALEENRLKNQELLEAKLALEEKNRRLDSKNIQLDEKNQQLDHKIEELIVAQQQADRIFSVLAESLPGTVLDGKYRLDEKIGSGGFGAVYRAEHLMMKRPIAVKIFRPSPGNDSIENLARFRLEGISACRINHPNAVQVFDSSISADGIAYLVMELLTGQTLKQELKQRGMLSIQRCAQLLLPICDVLAQAHENGIVHRDIKPDNIFLHKASDGSEVVKVVDFGIAKLQEDHQSIDIGNLTGAGRLIGTPAYIAPERFEGKPYDGRSDVYSLGVILYEILAGQLPFKLNSPGIFGLLAIYQTSTQTSNVEPLRNYRADIPAAVEAVVLRALSKDPVERPTAQALGREFLKAANLSLEMLATDGRDLPELSAIKLSAIKISADIKRRDVDRGTVSLVDNLDNVNKLIAQIDRDNLDNRWQQIEQLFHALLDCDISERAALLDRIAEVDAGLRAELASLLAAHQDVEAGDFFDSAANIASQMFRVNSDHLIGQQIDDKYRIEKSLGRFGLDALYQAVCLANSEIVTIKVIAAEYLSDEASRWRFEQEAQVAMKLDCASIIKVIDFGFSQLDHEQIGYLVMESLGGSTLRELLSDKVVLSLGQIAEVVDQVCLAIDTAQKAGVSDSGLNLYNIWLKPNGDSYQVKILDYGFSQQHRIRPLGMISGISGINRIGNNLNHRNNPTKTVQTIMPEPVAITGERSATHNLGQIIYEMLGREIPDSLTGLMRSTLSDNSAEWPINVMEFAAAFRSQIL